MGMTRRTKSNNNNHKNSDDNDDNDDYIYGIFSIHLFMEDISILCHNIFAANMIGSERWHQVTSFLFVFKRILENILNYLDKEGDFVEGDEVFEALFHEEKEKE